MFMNETNMMAMMNMQNKILNEFVPEYQKRLAAKGYAVCFEVASMGDTINLIVNRPNGIPICEFAFFIDQFNSPNWMPVYKVRG